ncbi:MAG: hypothetical protein AAGI51_16775 [Pseudomonadota bacterium]
MTPLAVVIPIRPPDGVRDKPRQRRVPAQTFRSIAAQDHRGRRAPLACGPQQRLPEPPPGVEAAPVDLPSAHFALEHAADRDAVLHALGVDKGRRGKAAVHDMGPRERGAPGDADAPGSRRRVGVVAERPPELGGVVRDGGSGRDGSRRLRPMPQLRRACGAGILRALDRFPKVSDPGAAPEDLRHDLGGPIHVKRRHEGRATAFRPPPVRGAVARQAQTVASQSLPPAQGFRPHRPDHGPRRRASPPLRGWKSWALSYLRRRPTGPRRDVVGAVPFKRYDGPPPPEAPPPTPTPPTETPLETAV